MRCNSGKNEINPFYLLQKHFPCENPSSSAILEAESGQKTRAERESKSSRTLALTHSLSTPSFKQFNFAAAFVAALLLK
jgi:hypothetical protein